MTSSIQPIRRALVSVYDKTGLTELAQDLAAAGVQIALPQQRHTFGSDRVTFM